MQHWSHGRLAWLKDALARLLEASTNEVESRVLGPGIVREVMFRILSGEQGQNLRRLALRGTGSQRVGGQESQTASAQRLLAV